VEFFVRVGTEFAEEAGVAGDAFGDETAEGIFKVMSGTLGR